MLERYLLDCFYDAGKFDDSILTRLKAVLKAMNLPVSPPSSLRKDGLETCLSFMKSDKKTRNSSIRMVLLYQIGKCSDIRATGVPESIVRRVLSFDIRVLGPKPSPIPSICGLEGTVTIPGSKSLTNRLLLLAALSATDTKIVDPLYSEDTEV